MKAHEDLRNILVGHVCTQPEIGKEMSVVETTLSREKNNVSVSYHIRTSTRVTHIDPLDGFRVLKVKTESGRTYIVECS